MRFIGALIFWLVLFILAGAIFAWSGVYDVGADAQHWSLTRHLIGVVREHSIEKRAADIAVPKLDDPALIALGAQHYSEMCTGCHLAPGVEDSDIRHGLNPRPPNLTRFAPDPAEAFWVIKHGIRMTGMPAWGPTHDDHKLWALVAYLQQQPKLSAEQYRKLVASAPKDDDDDAGMSMPMPMGSAATPASSGTH